MKRAFHAWHCSVWVMLWILSSCCNYFCSTCLLWEYLFSYSSDTKWCMLIFPHSGYLRRVVIFFWQSNSKPFKNGRTPNSLWFYSIPFSLIMLVNPTRSQLRCKHWCIYPLLFSVNERKNWPVLQHSLLLLEPGFKILVVKGPQVSVFPRSCLGNKSWIANIFVRFFIQISEISEKNIF